jgi:hypothetical protein
MARHSRCRRFPSGCPAWGSEGPVASFITNLDNDLKQGAGNASEQRNTQAQLRREAFIKKYPPTTPMIVGGIEEIRTDDAANEIYIADNAFGGRVMVFSLDKFEFKRGWGAYGHKLTEISTKPEDHAYTPGGPMAKEFVGHLTLISPKTGWSYAADRAATASTSPTSRATSSRKSRWRRPPASAAPPAA